MLTEKLLHNLLVVEKPGSILRPGRPFIFPDRSLIDYFLQPIPLMVRQL